MMPRRGRVAGRSTAAPERAYQSYSFPGPFLGWVSDQALAVSQPGGAFILENILPTATGGILRRGKRNHAQCSAPVRSLFSYNLGPVQRLFASTDGDIFDVTDEGEPVSEFSCTSGDWITAQYTTTNGDIYIRGVNGEDTPFVYDGTDFGTTPALTFPSPFDALTPDILSFCWVDKNRFWFIEKDSMDAWFLPVGQIGGELTRMPLGGEFSLGGSLMMGASWSIETGDGLSALNVFITTEGEVAVYRGADPADANAFAKVGTYLVGKPRGKRAMVRRGGDLVIPTDIGCVTLSQSLQKDAPTLAPSAMSAPIEVEWTKFVSSRLERVWAAEVWTGGQMMAIALPTGEGQTPTWLVTNARTGKWCVFTGWDASCLHVFGDRLFFGSPNGNVYEANSGGSDDGLPYVGVYVPVFDQMGVAGEKTVHMARAVMRSAPKAIERLSVHAEFRVELPSAPDVSRLAAADAWGIGSWGVAIWGGGDYRSVQDAWRNQFGGGEAVTIAHQVTSQNAVALDTEFIRTDVLFTTGGVQS